MKPGAHQAVLTARMLPSWPDTVRAAPGSARRSRIGASQSATSSVNDAHCPCRGASRISSSRSACSGTDTCGACRCSMATVGHRPRGERGGRDLGEALGVDTQHDLGQQVGEPVLQRHGARIAAQRGGLQLGEHLRDVLERAVLQQPREQQVAHLEQRQVLLVVAPRRPAAAGRP